MQEYRVKLFLHRRGEAENATPICEKSRHTLQRYRCCKGMAISSFFTYRIYVRGVSRSGTLLGQSNVQSYSTGGPTDDFRIMA